MDGDSCFKNVIEVAPADNFTNNSDFSDVKYTPVHVKVCVFVLYNVTM